MFLVNVKEEYLALWKIKLNESTLFDITWFSIT